MGVIDTIRSLVRPSERATMPPALPYIDNYWPFANLAGGPYGLMGLQQTLQGKGEPIAGGFAGYAAAFEGNSIVYACMLARSSLFSEARFMYRQLRSGRPGELFSLPELDLLRTPWPGGTTGDLLARAIQDVDLAGNAFFVRRPGRIKRLRPDWVTIILGSERDPDTQAGDLDAETIGYVYHPGGMYSGRPAVILLREEVAHFAPIPDPLAMYRGMSWITPLVREIEADNSATAHKSAFFTNGATPNMVVSLDPAITGTAWKEWVEKFSDKYDGTRNAYKTMYLGAGAKVEVVGRDLQQLDFKATQGAGETRIAAAAGVPAVVVGISEGLAGSSLNAGNFNSAMRRFADVTMRPLWRNFAGSLSTIMPPPPGSELWYDDRDIPALKDDVMDAAEVQAKNASAIRQLVDAGFEPKSVVDAVRAGDLARLSHTGLYSVQLQPPMPEGPEPEAEPEAEDEAEDETEGE